ncbi:MAG: hypothetical protein WKG07_24940 [Hymenobacter sp.]
MLHSPGHALLPGPVLLRPPPAPPAAKPAEKDAREQEQAKGLRQANGGPVEQLGHQPIPQVLGQENRRRDKQGREEGKSGGRGAARIYGP